jgi:hypothetical protein
VLDDCIDIILHKLFVSVVMFFQIQLDGVEGAVFFQRLSTERGRDSSADIANRYGLEGPGIDSRWGRKFPQPSRPVLRPT